MYTETGCCRLFSAASVYRNLDSKCTLLIVALVLLNSLSSGQLVPSSHGSPEPTSRSNASLSSNGLKEYVIYSVVEGSSRDSDNERVRLHLGMILAPSEVHEYGGDYTGVEFWHVRMTDMQRSAFVAANPKVCSILDREKFTPECHC